MPASSHPDPSGGCALNPRCRKREGARNFDGNDSHPHMQKHVAGTKSGVGVCVLLEVSQVYKVPQQKGPPTVTALYSQPPTGRVGRTEGKEWYHPRVSPPLSDGTVPNPARGEDLG